MNNQNTGGAMKPRKHAEAIKAWADGAQIQYRQHNTLKWMDSDQPAFVEDYEYRVKPAREYPTTQMTRNELVEVVRSTSGGFSDSYAALVNAGLRHACDTGQVVTREEFDRAAGGRKARDMAIAEAVRDACHEAAEAPFHRTVPLDARTSIDAIRKVHLTTIIAKVQA